MQTIPMSLYKKALHEDVCSVCSCYECSEEKPTLCVHELSGNCPVFAKLPQIVETVSSVKSDYMQSYVHHLRRNVCSVCEHQNEEGVCEVRDSDGPEHSWCILDSYFEKIVESVERVRAEHAG